MRRVALAAVAASFFLVSAPAHAGPYLDQLVTCMVDSSTRDDRMAVMDRFSLVFEDNKDKAKSDAADKRESEVMIRLATQNCRAQTQAVAANEGDAAFDDLPYNFRMAVTRRMASEK